MNTLKTFFLPITILLLFSCGSRNEKRANIISLDIDSVSLKLKYADAIFTIPSPNQTLLLLKNYDGSFNINILGPAAKTEKYTTTFKKSIVLGMYGADVCLLNLYNQKELALHYLTNIKNMVEDLNLGESIPENFFNKIEEHFGNNDTVINYLAILYKECDEYLKNNDRYDIGSLIITGGWIESFYILTNLYSKNKDQKLFALILYQKEVIDNLIKLLAPLYNANGEYKNLIDDLTNIAYEFDVIDTNQTINSIFSDTLNKTTTVRNESEFQLTGSQLENIHLLAQKIRDKYM
jgi:hypothetical protein